MRLRFLLLTIFSVIVFSSGCQVGDRPRLRFGCYPTSTIGTTFLDPNNLGKHSFKGNFIEKNGIVYTCKAGHIDLIHVRIAGDWTRYLTGQTRKGLMSDKAGFSFKFQPDNSMYYVSFDYPDNWNSLTVEEKSKIADEVAIRTGKYLAFTAITWHEILTWFGYKCVGFFPEFPSAFSWEDSFSNLLGTHVAEKALADSSHSYDEAMTIAINEELKELGVQPKQTARLASEKVRDKWFDGQLLYMVDMKKRNFDIGLDDGLITPTIIDGIDGCAGSQPRSDAVPRIESLGDYGFALALKIEPKEWERGKILKVVYPDAKQRKKYVEPAVHLPVIMNHIKQEAQKKGYIFE
jgi:hypothetical protein